MPQARRPGPLAWWSEPVGSLHANIAQRCRGQVRRIERLGAIRDQQRATAVARGIAAGRMHEIRIEHKDVARAAGELDRA